MISTTPPTRRVTISRQAGLESAQLAALAACNQDSRRREVIAKVCANGSHVKDIPLRARVLGGRLPCAGKFGSRALKLTPAFSVALPPSPVAFSAPCGRPKPQHRSNPPNSPYLTSPLPGYCLFMW